ncbi:unnamed protein product, partial [Polarella glacialis]
MELRSTSFTGTLPVALASFGRHLPGNLQDRRSLSRPALELAPYFSSEERPSGTVSAVASLVFAAVASAAWRRSLVGREGRRQSSRQSVTRACCWGSPRARLLSLQGGLRGRGAVAVRAKRKGDREPEEASPWDQAVWSGAEVLGNLRAAVVGGSAGESKTSANSTASPARSREELSSRLRADYDTSYFLTGDMDVELYSEDCEFSDPFAGFRGRERFVQNLRNLAGGFITDYRVKLLDFDEGNSSTSDKLSVRSRSLVQLELALPWRPTLGWVWGVTHDCECRDEEEESGAVKEAVWRCVAHREAWEIDPAEGVAMVFRPGKGLPPIGDEGLVSLAAALEGLAGQGLRKLDFGSNKIANAGADRLAKALHCGSCLRLLDLRGNQIGDQGAASLAEALAVQPELEELQLGGNKVGEVGAKALAAAV